MAGYSVLGVARSGVAAANALARRGANVQVADLRDEAALADHLARLDPRVAVRLGGNHFRPGDVLVVSPGIPPRAPVFAEARAAGCEIIGEIGLYQRLDPERPILCVTGTDGKSTTTAWLGSMCEAAGLPTWVGGNIGIPLCASLDTLDPEHVVVAEVSCFQLWTSPGWHPRVAALTNIAADHLDYYDGSFEAYVAAKRAVMRNVTVGDSVILNTDDPILAGWTAPGGAATLGFGRVASPPRDGLRLEAGELVARMDGVEHALIGASELPIPGGHNVENAMAAAGAALAFGVPADAVRAALRSFGGLEHRIERVDVIDGVTWFNDSKATNPHAGEAALTAFEGQKVVLLAGGSEKGSDFGDWSDLAVTKVEHIICFGETADRILEAIGDRIPNHRVADLAAAVSLARGIAAEGWVVVLSPVCASYDQFQSFEHRGRAFKSLLRTDQDRPG